MCVRGIHVLQVSDIGICVSGVSMLSLGVYNKPCITGKRYRYMCVRGIHVLQVSNIGICVSGISMYYR